MRYIHETIKFDQSLPANIFAHEVDVLVDGKNII